MTPIKTIIRNKTAVAKAVNYIGKNPVWLPANGEAVVDFEIWSVADDSQKTAIKTLVRSGTIELTIMVLTKEGEYAAVAFDPTAGEVIATPKVMTAPAKKNDVKKMVDEKDHIVKVGSPESQAALESMGAKPIGFQDEDIIPPREIKNGDPEPKEEAKQEEPIKDEPAVADNGAAEKKAVKKGTKQKA